MKTFFTLSYFFLLSIFAFGQIDFDNGQNQLYQSIVSILDNENAPMGPGYVIASTAYKFPDTRGEILRLDPNGNVIWDISLTHISQSPSQAKCRITHIEKYHANGQIQYLVVGSMNYTTTGSMFVAILDDNGIILQDMEYQSNSNPFLTGIKGIHSPSNNEFTLIGVDSDGFANTNNKNVLVLGLDENSLNVNWQHQLSTPNFGRDYDMVTDIINLPGGEFFITGTSNTLLPSATFSSEAVMCARINQGGVVWNKNFNTLNNSWDAGSSALYNPTTNSILVLGNNSLNHALHITELKASNGAILTSVYGSDVYNNYDKFGFELKFKQNSFDQLIISGYEFKHLSSSGTIGDMYTFLIDIDANLSNVNQVQSYTANNSINPANGIYNMNENSMLFLTANEFPYYYNNMMDYRSDLNGYVMVSNSNSNNPNYYGKKITTTSNSLWTADGYNQVCGAVGTEYTLNPGIRIPTPSNTPVNQTISEMSNVLQWHNINRQQTICNPLFKKESITSIDNLENDNMIAFPNPMTDKIQVKNNGEATNFFLYDLVGKQVAYGTFGQSEYETINVNHLESGSYLLIIKNNKQETQQQLIQKID